MEYEPSKKESDDRGQSKKKIMFLEIEENNDNDHPEKYRHIRISEKVLKEEFYQTIASLIGVGLSTPEAISAVVIVGNGMFGTKWKNH